MKVNHTQLLLLILIWSGIWLPACKTKSEIRREQEYERIKLDVRDAKGTRADLEVVSEELKNELSRVTAVVDEQGQQLRSQNEDLRRELSTLTTRIIALEQRAASEDVAAKQQATERAERSRPTYENAKRFYDEQNYDDAIEILRGILHAKPRGDEGRRSQFLLAESCFAAKDYASAALEYGEFKKDFPKDNQVPYATYRQAVSFKNLGKIKEAKLFYQELTDRFPKNPLAAKARAEAKKLK